VDWTALAAIGTLFLAAATVAVIVQTGLARRHDARAAVAELIRAAVHEQLENLRLLGTLDPSRGDGRVVLPLASVTLPVAHVDALVDGIDLPEQLAVYMIWLLASIARQREELRGLLEPLAGLQVSGLSEPIQARYRVLVDELQVLLCLVQGEARRRKMSAVAELGTGVSWTRPRPRPGNMRVGDRITEEAYLQAPPFPAHPAYARCDVGPREEEARRLEQERQTAMSGSIPPTKL
jgi:hypothetical protein